MSAQAPADCRHSREPFDTHFHRIDERRDITWHAKAVYGKLVTLHRLNQAWTQTQIGEALGLSRHQVWYAIAELIAVGLVAVIHHGQGLPNSYVLYGIDQENLDGNAPRRSDRQQGAGRSDQVRPSSFKRKETTEKNGKPGPVLQAGQCAGCGSRDHRAEQCPKYGHVFRR